MKQWLLIILAMGALIIGYRQLIMEKFLGWFVTHDAIRVMAAPVSKALITMSSVVVDNLKRSKWSM